MPLECVVVFVGNDVAKGKADAVPIVLSGSQLRDAGDLTRVGVDERVSGKFIQSFNEQAESDHGDLYRELAERSLCALNAEPPPRWR